MDTMESTIASILASPIPWFRSAGIIFLDQKAIGCHWPVFSISWEIMAESAKPEASGSNRIFLRRSKWMSMGAWVNAVFSASKVAFASGVRINAKLNFPLLPPFSSVVSAATKEIVF